MAISNFVTLLIIIFQRYQFSFVAVRTLFFSEKKRYQCSDLYAPVFKGIFDGEIYVVKESKRRKTWLQIILK